jgi:hypothetical protein
MAKIELFNKGDIILTNPEEGFCGIAVVLSEREKTRQFSPMCHIAITPIISQKEIQFSELNMSELTPLDYEKLITLEYQKRYKPKDFKPFLEIETCIGVFTRKNKTNLKVIGNIDPKIVYNGPLPFEPLANLKITWPLCGETNKNLGREAFITWERKKLGFNNWIKKHKIF